MVNNQSLDELLRRLATFQTDAFNFGVPIANAIGDISRVLSQMETNHKEAQESIVGLQAEVNRLNDELNRQNAEVIRLNAEVIRLNQEVSTLKTEAKKCSQCEIPEDFLACKKFVAEQ